MGAMHRAKQGSRVQGRGLWVEGGVTRVERRGLSDEGSARIEGKVVNQDGQRRLRWHTEAERGMGRPWERRGNGEWGERSDGDDFGSWG
eukprot:460526-Rhodomonas_salina.1